MVPIEFLWLIFPVIGIFIASLTWYVRYSLGNKNMLHKLTIPGERIYAEQAANVTSGLQNWDQLSDVALNQYDRYLRTFNIIWVIAFAVWNIIINYGSTALLHNYYA